MLLGIFLYHVFAGDCGGSKTGRCYSNILGCEGLYYCPLCHMWLPDLFFCRQVDCNATVSDFNEKVPNMAHTVKTIFSLSKFCWACNLPTIIVQETPLCVRGWLSVNVVLHVVAVSARSVPEAGHSVAGATRECVCGGTHVRGEDGRGRVRHRPLSETPHQVKTHRVPCSGKQGRKCSKRISLFFAKSFSTAIIVYIEEHRPAKVVLATRK